MKPEISFVHGSDTFYRFIGDVKDGTKFCVQIKENRKRQKYFISVFPID